MATLSKLVAITIDCADPTALADFYKTALGWELIYSDENAAYLSDGGPLRVGFQKVADYTPPKWPSQHIPQQMHLDIAVDDLDEASARMVGFGAAVADDQPGENTWRVMLDPAGHPFCLTTSY